jgi:hypothetical protein
VIHGIGSTLTLVLLGRGIPGVSVIALPGKCSCTMYARDSSGEVHSCFLTSPSLLDGLALRIFDSFAIAGSVSTSLTYSWILVFLACLMQFFRVLLRMLRYFRSAGWGPPRRCALLYCDR